MTIDQRPEPVARKTYQELSGDGWDWVAGQDTQPGWSWVANWGSAGWSLPEFPYVAFSRTVTAMRITVTPTGRQLTSGRGPGIPWYVPPPNFRHLKPRELWGARYRVEGDIEEVWFATVEERDAWIDSVAWWHWRREPAKYFDEDLTELVAGLSDSLSAMPSFLRGPSVGSSRWGEEAAWWKEHRNEPVQR